MPFSYSQLSTYRTCPKQYEFASIKKLPRQISAGESFGSSIHNALAAFGKREVESGKMKEERAQLQLFTEPNTSQVSALSSQLLTDLWHQSFITEGYASKQDADAARAKGEVIMKHFYAWWSQSPRDVITIESGFKWESPDHFTVSGRFDRIEQLADGLHVIDFKTGSVRSQESVDSDLQLSIYALASEHLFQAPCTKLTLLFLQEDGIIEVSTSRSQEQLDTAMQEMNDLVTGIDTDVFDPTPSASVCGRCPYRGICDSAEV